MDDHQVRTEKLQKVLARLGLGSRRELETWIENGRVSVNGKRSKLGDRVSERDVIRVDGRRLTQRGRKAGQGPGERVIAYHKPPGEVTTHKDPEGRPTVYQGLPRLQAGRWIPVGRLDINTSGLLLFTTDGDLAHALMHPSSAVTRDYAVRVFGDISPEVVKRLLEGVELDDGIARFDLVEDAGGEGVNHWYRVTLKEGRNREVRRLWESQGVQVSRLIRTGYGPVALPRRLRPGRWQELDDRQRDALREAAGLMPLRNTGKRKMGASDQGRGARRKVKRQKARGSRHEVKGRRHEA